MSNVVDLGRGVHLSLRGLQDETGFDRDTIGKRLSASDVKPSGKRGGHPVYRLRDVLKALFVGGDDGEIDPDKLEPFQRKAHYQAEHEKLKLQVERGELVPRIEVEQEQARTAKLVAQFFDTLPDVLERDCGASPMLLAKLEQRLDDVRESLYRELMDEESDAVGSAGIRA